MRLLFLLLIAAVTAYYTNPERAEHEASARAALQAYTPTEAPDDGLSIDDVVAFVQGAMAGEGRYENFFLASKYSVDMPGSNFMECYGAFTFVQCSVKEPGAAK